MRPRLGSCSVPMADEIMNGAGAGARCSVHVLLPVAMLAIGLDVGVARITYGVALPAFARDLQLSLTAAGLLGTLHLIGYLLGTLASPSLNAKVGALALCRASHLVFACAMLVCGLTSDTTTMAASRFVAGVAAGFSVFSIFLIVFDATETGEARRRGIARLVRRWRRNCRERARFRPDSGQRRMAPVLHRAGLAGTRGRGVHSARTASAARARPQAASAVPSRLVELTSARWIFLVAAYFAFAAGCISYSTFAGVRLKESGLSPVGITWFWLMYGASSIAGSALGAATLLSGAFARRIALSAALGSGAIGSLLVVHGENWSVFAASVLMGLGLVATPAIVTFLIRNRTSDAAYHHQPGRPRNIAATGRRIADFLRSGGVREVSAREMLGMENPESSRGREKWRRGESNPNRGCAARSLK